MTRVKFYVRRMIYTASYSRFVSLMIRTPLCLTYNETTYTVHRFPLKLLFSIYVELIFAALPFCLVQSFRSILIELLRFVNYGKVLLEGLARNIRIMLPEKQPRFSFPCKVFA